MSAGETPGLEEGTPAAATAAPHDAQAFVRIEGLSKTFGARPAVTNVDLEIRRGELFSILGASGCGKTTLLRMLAGLIIPDAGRIVIDGEDVTRLPAHRRPVNIMFQSYALFPHMTVEQNIAYGLKKDGVPRAAIKERVGAMLDLVKLGPELARRPHELSGGQQQRVALARALIKEPKVLLLDEPFAALDKKLRVHTRFELAKLQAKLGLTFVVVTHDQEEAMSISSRIAVMDRGRFRQVGTPADVYERPANRFIADFIGDVNLFEGVVARRGNGPVVRSAELGRDLLAPLDAAASGAVCLAVRPENVQIGLRPPGPEQANVLDGVLRRSAYHGDTFLHHVELGGGRLVQVREPNRSRFAEPGLAEGQAVFVWFAPSSAVVLGD